MVQSSRINECIEILDTIRDQVLELDTDAALAKTIELRGQLFLIRDVIRDGVDMETALAFVKPKTPSTIASCLRGDTQTGMLTQSQKGNLCDTLRRGLRWCRDHRG